MSMNDRNNRSHQAVGTYSNPESAMAAAMPDGARERGIAPAVWATLTTSIYVGAAPDSVLAVWDYCHARRLDPLKRPAHIVPMRVTVDGRDVWRDVIMPGIYELRTTAMRTGEYVGQDDPEFGPAGPVQGLSGAAPEWCRVTVYRWQHGERRAYPHIAYFAEECARKSGGEVNSMWTRRPRGQLAKVAEAGALRKAFPEELGGVQAAEELEGKAVTIDAEPERERSKAAPPSSDALALGPGGQEYGRDELLQLAAAAAGEDDLAYLSTLVNQIRDPRTKIQIGNKLADAARRVAGARA